MRLLFYGVFDKTTGKKLFSNLSLEKCENFIKEANNNNLEIRYRWFSA